ncbi:UNVERIFIED_CONTAM: hypothetical protein HDU68_007553 [Siphonaria sp. JEL0065]|nr:hypothetical protein HDU68_007553 [Siphonaria sp. JEL0065]
MALSFVGTVLLAAGLYHTTPAKELIDTSNYDPTPKVIVPKGPKGDHLHAKAGVASIIIHLEQDIFAEISHLIEPIAEATVLEMKVEDQHITKKIPFLGEKEVAAATGIKVQQFDIKAIRMTTEEGFLAISILNTDFKITLNLSVLNGKARTVTVTTFVDITAKVKFGIQDKKIKTKVSDVKVTLKEFDAHMEAQFGKGEMLNHAVDLVENTLQKLIESTLASTISSSLESGLDSVMARNWDVNGNVSRVFYNCTVEFLGDPVITKVEGARFTLGIDVGHEVKAQAPVPESVETLHEAFAHSADAA